MKIGRLTLALSLMVAMVFIGTLPPVAVHAAPAIQTDASSSGLVDINSASATELATLPGIGTAYAQKIIGGRPYANKTQLTSRNIISPAVYSKISSKIIAKHPAKAPK